MGSIFKKDIVLDEEAFQTAGNEFKTLSADMESLKAEVDEMLQLIKIGFDTPAGAKFIQSCQTTLIIGFSLLNCLEFFVFRKMKSSSTINHPLCGCESNVIQKKLPFRVQ